MSDEYFRKREQKRALRLLSFVQGELREMFVGARLNFTAQIMEYLLPEINELERKRKRKQ